MMLTTSRRMLLLQVELIYLMSLTFNGYAKAECDPPPKIPFGKMTSPTQQLFYEGEKVTYSCGRGFRPVGESTIICVDGQWSATSFECHVVVCGDPGSPDNGKRNGLTFQFGSQVRFTCNEGYSLIGRSSTFCQSDQTWSNPIPVCTASQCPSLEAPINGRIFPSNQATFGAVVRFYCDDDKYLWTGSPQRTCQSDGTWSGSDGACQVNCGPFADISENVLYRATNKTTAGAVITFKCPRGFMMYGSPKTVCTESGTWSHQSPACRVINCGDPGAPINGRRIGLNFEFGSSISFTCDEGYTLRGRQQTYCQVDQTWSNPVPICQVVECPPMYQPDHGRVFPSGTLPYGTTVQYNCNKGYRWTGSLVRTCRSNGTWDGQGGTCEVVDCGMPKNVEENHVEYSPNNTKAGDMIYFSCFWGYDLKGPEYAECGYNGEWSVSTPRCMERCAHAYFEHGLWETQVPLAVHGQRSSFHCDTDDHDPDPEDEMVTCNDGVWKPTPKCVYDRPGWCFWFWNKDNPRCKPY